jgi:hypothetical protein
MRTTVKTGPKRRRRTRRELPEGGYTQWMHIGNFKRELEIRRADPTDPPIRAYRYR